MDNLEQVSADFAKFAQKNNVILTTAESCTAGLISATVAMTSGSSAWLDRAFVVYTPEAKCEMLDVNLETIEQHNITSKEVALEMASGALKKSLANVSISVTGVAGPNGGTEEIPVGTVCMAWCFFQDVKLLGFAETKVFSGSRNEIREQVVEHTLRKLMALYSENVLYDF